MLGDNVVFRGLLYQPLEQFENKCIYFGHFEGFLIVLNFFDLNFFYLFFLIVFNCFINFELIFYFSLYMGFFLNVFVFVKDLVIIQINDKAQVFVPIFFVFFIYILFFNILGLYPFAFCVTSQLLVTFTLSFSLFFGVTFFGFYFNGFHFLFLFVPKNVPIFLLPFLIVIEFVSYISRLFSLAIRLFANMVAGHALLHILLGSFVVFVKFVKSLVFLPFFLFPLCIIGSILLLEMGIAFLQTYVFLVLFAIYFNDSFSCGSH